MARQKMSSTTNQAGINSNTPPVQLTFGVDAAYPATVVTSNALVVAGGGVANINVSVTYGGAGFSASSYELRKNGVSIGSQTVPAGGGTRTLSVTNHTLAAGDLLTVYHVCVINGVSTAQTRSVDVIPV